MTRSPADVPVSERIGSQRTRRRYVAAMYGGYLVLGLGLLVGDGTSGALRLGAGVAALVGLAGALAGFGYLMRRTAINAPQISSAALDERLRARRDRVTWIASLANAIVFSLFAAYATLAMTLVPAWAPPGVLAFLLWTAALLATTLPTAILAWSERDPLAPEDET